MMSRVLPMMRVVGAMGRITTRMFALRLPRFLGLVVLMYVGAWLVSFAAGGASTVPPHAFYVPIAVVGTKLGIRGAIVAGVLAALVAGPALPADVSTGASQAMSEWVSRGVFFVAVGATVTHLTNAAVGTVLAAAEREAELLHAIEADQLVVLYQPVVRIDTGVVVGVEALVRWAHPTRGMVGPCDFVPFAEERGIIGAIGHWVLQRSVSDMYEWKDTPGIEDLPIRELAINVSRRQFGEDGRLLDQLDDLIRDRPLPIQLVVEVTETALAENPALLAASLIDLKRRGVQVAIDDFGTGQSSVAAVRDLPIDIIKIDKTFVDGLTTDSSDRQIVENTVALADRLGKRTIAEGVETSEQVDALVALGVRQAQGYLLGRPMPIEELRRWVTDRPTRPAPQTVTRRVLVVDDRRADRTYIEYLLQDFCQIDVATSGAAAVEVLQRETFTVVLLDIHMPGMSGFDTIRAIRDQEARTGRARQLVLGLSSRDLPEDEHAARRAGMDGYLTKPLNATRLDAELRRLGRPPLTTFCPSASG